MQSAQEGFYNLEGHFSVLQFTVRNSETSALHRSKPQVACWSRELGLTVGQSLETQPRLFCEDAELNFDLLVS
jgi:hypothetical protein